jgi:filamentous hemagglutinin family protein
MPHFLLNSESPSAQMANKPLRRGLAYGLSLLIIWQPLLLSAQPLTPTHNTYARPTVDQAANGVPVVNIQVPNSTGLSQNFYNDFNVDNRGLILNNSQQISQTQLGGFIEGNPNLTGGAASLILNEVISNRPSALNGYIEVGGSRADVVVANPNGISCNGCGFINTNHATLSTGQPIMHNGALSGFDVQGGTISILDGGLNAANTSRFDIIARSVEIAGELHADTLNIVTGQQTVERASLNTSNISSDDNTPSFAIDSTALGGMYANRIRLIANEEGVGVRLDAPVAAQNGDLSISANGNIQYSDLAATQDIVIEAGQHDVSGTGTAVAMADVLVNADSITNTGTLGGHQSLTLNATEIVNDAGGALLSGGNITLSADTVTNRLGDIYALGDIDINGSDGSTPAQRVENRSGSIQAQGDLNISAEELLNVRDVLEWDEALAGGQIVHTCHECSGDHFTMSYKFTEHFFRQLTEATTEKSLLFSGGVMTLNGTHLVNETSDILAYGDMTLGFDQINNVGLHTGEYLLTTTYGGYMTDGTHISNVLYSVMPYNQRNYYGGASYWGGGADYDLEYMALNPNADNPHYDPDNFYTRDEIGLGSTSLWDQSQELLDSTDILGANILSQGNLDMGEATVFNGDFGHDERGSVAQQEFTALGHDGTVTDFLAGVNGGLFSYADPSHPYLIETNPFFASADGFLGSTYLLNRLEWDPDGSVRLLGDGFYEQQLIRQQIVDLTGRVLLDPAYVDANAQYSALLDNGWYAAEDLELAVGVTLTADQINNLTNDIVWMVEQEVAGEIVLVPQLYLSPQSANLNSVLMSDNRGALIGAGGNLINNGGSIVNSGTLYGGNDVLFDLNENGIQNLDGNVIAENTLHIKSEGDIKNVGGTLQGDEVILDSIGDIVNQRWAEQRDYQQGGVHEWHTSIGNAAVIRGADSVTLNAGKNIDITASEVHGGAVTLDAQGNINIGTVADNSGRQGTYYGGTLSESRVRHLSSDISSTIKLIANAANDLTVMGSNLASDGDIQLSSGNDLIVASVANSDSYNFLVRDDGETTHSIDRSVRHQASTVNGQGNVTLESGNNLSVIASRLEAAEDLSLMGEGDIELLAERDSDYRYRYEEDDGDYGKSKTSTTESESQRSVGSSLHAGGALSLKTEAGDVKLIASTGYGEKAVHVDSGRDVYIESRVNSDYSRTQTTNKNAARVKTRDQGNLTQTLAQAGLSSGADLTIDAEGDVLLAAAQLESQGDLRIGDASLAVDESGALRLDDEGNPIIDRGSIDNLYIGTVALGNESWDAKTRSLRGPVKGLAKAFSAVLAMIGVYMPIVAVAVADNEPEIELAEMTETRSHEYQEVGSVMQAENIQLSVQDDMVLTGSSLTADEESGKVVMLADNILLDTAITKTTLTERNQVETASGIQASLKKDELTLGGLRLTDREQGTITTAITHSGSSIKGNQVVLDAQGNLKLIHANIEATGEDGYLSLAGDAVEITGVQDELVVTDTLTEKVTETSVGIRNAYVDAAYAVKGVAEAGSAVDDARGALEDAEKRVSQGTLAKDALDDYRIMLATATANLVQAELAAAAALAATAAGAAAAGTGFYVSGSAQHSESTSTTTTAEKTWQGSNLSAAYMTVNADKASVIGSNITAGQLDLNATDILIGAGKNEQSSSSTQKSKTGGFSASSNGAGSWNANVGTNKADSESNATQYVNSQINVGHLESSSDNLTVKGGVVAANTANISTSKLHIESLQDTHSSSNSSSGANIGIGGGISSTGVVQGGSAGFNKSNGSGEGAQVNEQSAILIADGENSQITAKDTTLIGGMIANASREIDAETGEVSLVDHGNLNFSTETLTVEDLRDYSKSDQHGFGLQLDNVVSFGQSGSTGSVDPNTKPPSAYDKAADHFDQGTTTFSLQNTGRKMEGETRATIGGGNVVVGGQSLHDHKDFTTLNRNVNEAQVVILDQQTGALDASVTIENRMLSETGRADIVGQHKNLKNNIKATTGGALGDAARIAVVAASLIQPTQADEALDRIDGAQHLAYLDDGELAASVEAFREGNIEDALAAQELLNQTDAALNSSDGDRVLVTEGAFNLDGSLVAGAANPTSGALYADMSEGSRSSIVNTLAHEGMHLSGSRGWLAGATGYLADFTYRANAWANSSNIDSHGQIYMPIQNSLAHHKLLSQNTTSFARDAVNNRLEYRQLSNSEFDFLLDSERISRFAVLTGQSEQYARRELISSSAAAIDASWALALEGNEANSLRAREFLTLELQKADSSLFQVTDYQFRQPRIGLKEMMSDPRTLRIVLDNLAQVDPARYRFEPAYREEILQAQAAGSSAGMAAVATTPFYLPKLASSAAGWTLYAITQPGQAADQIGDFASDAWVDFRFGGYDDALSIMQGDVYGVEFDKASFTTEFGIGLGMGASTARILSLGRPRSSGTMRGDIGSEKNSTFQTNTSQTQLTIRDRYNHHQDMVDDVKDQLASQGYRVSEKEVSFGSSCGTGRCRPDIIAEAPDGNIRIIEIKTGNADLSIRQSEIFPQIENGNSIPRGAVAEQFGLTPGIPLKDQGYPDGIPIDIQKFPGVN